MSRTLSLTAQSAIFAQETGEVLLFIVEIDHDDWGSPVRLVNNNEDITSNGNVYTGFPFEITLPTDNPDRSAQATITICNVDRQIIALLDALQTAPTVTLSIIVASDPDVVLGGSAEFDLSDYEGNALMIEGTLSHSDAREEPIPAHQFSPNDWPGLFA